MSTDLHPAALLPPAPQALPPGGPAAAPARAPARPAPAAAVGAGTAPEGEEFSSTFKTVQGNSPAASTPASAPQAAPPAGAVAPARQAPQTPAALLQSLLAGTETAAATPDGALPASLPTGQALPEGGQLLPPGLEPAPRPEASAELPAPVAAEPAGATAAVPVPVTPPAQATAPPPTVPDAGVPVRAETATPPAPPTAPARPDGPQTLAASPAADSAMPPSTPGGGADAGSGEAAGDGGGTPDGQRSFANLRELLQQTGPSASPRFSLGAEAAQAAASASGMTGPPPAGFAEPLTSLAPAAAQAPPLQPMGDPQAFARQLGERLSVMAEANGVSNARIRLHPEHLGPLEVRVQVDEDVARVWFSAHQGHTREALEQALPRLREMFAEQGLQLVRADVAGGGERQGQPGQAPEPALPDWLRGRESERGIATLAGLALTPPGAGGQRLLDVLA